jgi:undecaprenyl-diphosphatase
VKRRVGAARAVGWLGAASVVVWSGCAARRGVVSDREAAVFRTFNEPPPVVDRLEVPAGAVMQAGSLGGVFAVTGVVGARQGSRRAAGVFGVGGAVWFAMKIVKPLVGRGRPDDLLDGVTVRGQPQTGLGYPSGHAAVSTTLALVATTGGPARVAALAVAAVAGTSRMYVGAHLPLDVVGGFAAGALAGSVGSRLTG